MFKKIIFLTFLTVTSIVFSQNKVKTSDLNSLKLEEQFDFIIKNSNKYQDYKVIKKEWILRIQKNVNDSISTVQKKYDNSKQTISLQKEKIALLNNQLIDTKKNVTSLNEEKDAISLFGISMSKSFYNTLLWSIITALLGFLLFFIFQYKKSNSITKAIKKSLDEVESEFDAHRKRALEREQKVMRKLQDEINKQKKD